MTPQHWVAVVGSRDYKRLDKVVAYVQNVLPNVTIVSGHGGKVDLTAEYVALKCGLRTKIFPAKWEIYGKAAGPRRNLQIVLIVDEVVAFWDMESPGTRDTIEKARLYLKPVTIIRE